MPVVLWWFLLCALQFSWCATKLENVRRKKKKNQNFISGHHATSLEAPDYISDCCNVELIIIQIIPLGNGEADVHVVHHMWLYEIIAIQYILEFHISA